MIGTAAKWASEDFSYIGIVASMANGRIELMTNEGLMSFSEDDGTLTAKPTIKLDLSIPVAKPVAVKKTLKAGSKVAQAVAHIKAHLDAGNDFPSRKEGMKMLMDDLNFGSGTASTYFATAKRELV